MIFPTLVPFEGVSAVCAQSDGLVIWVIGWVSTSRAAEDVFDPLVQAAETIFEWCIRSLAFDARRALRDLCGYWLGIANCWK